MDRIAAKKQQAIRLARQTFGIYASLYLQIRTKAGDIKPFKLNREQLYLHEQAEKMLAEVGFVRIILVKARQFGGSTYIGARFYYWVSGAIGKRVFILTHEIPATTNLFRMAKRFHEHMPAWLRPHTAASNAKELIFDKIDSSYVVATAGGKAVGRSDTIQYFHGSEVAYWPSAEDHAGGALQAVPLEPGTEVWLESTGAGMNNWFYKAVRTAQKGMTPYRVVFIPWFWHEEYRQPVPEGFLLDPDDADYMQAHGLDREQMAFRSAKIGEFGGDDEAKIRFMREYPATLDEAFRTSDGDSFIPSAPVLRARRATVEPYGPEIFGVDCAWDGRTSKDRSVVYSRRGRFAERLGWWRKVNTMQLAGHVARLIDARRPVKVFIDTVGIGAGVYDRLCELGYAGVVVAVHGGEQPLDTEQYINKRAECWGEMKDWLTDKTLPVSIPDDDDLHADMTAPQSKRDSKYRLQIESKESMKKRGVSSPDNADALALTFAYPVSEKAMHDTPDPRRPINWRAV